jgi:hypothetical protein
MFMFADENLNFYTEIPNIRNSIKMKNIANGSTIYTKKIPIESFLKQKKYTKRQLLKLRKSIWPTQYNNYVLLKYPPHMKEKMRELIQNGEYEYNSLIRLPNIPNVPCDYKLVQLIKFLWSYGLVTHMWNQPYVYPYHSDGHIHIYNETKDGENALIILKNLITLYDNIRIDSSAPHYFTLRFSECGLMKLYEQLKLKMIDVEKSLAGNIFNCTYVLAEEYDQYKELLGKVKNYTKSEDCRKYYFNDTCAKLKAELNVYTPNFVVYLPVSESFYDIKSVYTNLKKYDLINE